MEGSAKALAMAADSIQRDVFARLKRDLDENKVSEDEAKNVDRYLHTCVNFLKHLSKQAETQSMMAHGRVSEAQDTIKLLKAEMDAEEKKLQAAAAAVESGEAEMVDGELVFKDGFSGKRPANRPPGAHPGANLKAEREEEGKRPTNGKGRVPPKKKRAVRSKRAKNAR